VKTAERFGADGAAEIQRRWRSPIRGPWLTSVLGLVLLIGIPIEFVTGLLSYAAYDPKAGNDPNPAHGLFGFYLFDWFTAPSWAYRLIQGVHIILGFALVPVVLAKLWSVIPRLFEWPVWRSIAHLLERITLVMLVGGVVFEFVSGIFNIGYVYGYAAFYPGHFYGAWIFMAAFVVHVCLKLPKMVHSLRSRRFRTELKTGLAGTQPEPYTDGGLVALNPAAPTMSRRAVLALVGGTSLVVVGLTAGQTVGGALRRVAWFGNRYAAPGTGPNHFLVNHTAAEVGIGPDQTGPSWSLELVGSSTIKLTRDELLAMPQITADLPIACTEGWSTTQRWTGVRLADLASQAGIARPGPATLEALDGSGVVLTGSQVNADQCMVALKVNGADLSLDHGYPARVMVPAAPGNHNKKWMSRITFEEA
jgi:DMSO/TMAO reductase YedYZ molybdopterin-dependent catalytic subunit